MVAKISKFSKKRDSAFESAVVLGVFAVVGVGIIGFFVYGNITMAQKRSQLEAKLRELQIQAAELQARREALEESVAGTQTEEHVERILREQGLYKKEGEQVVTILSPEATPESTTEINVKKDRKWWNPWTW